MIDQLISDKETLSFFLDSEGQKCAHLEGAIKWMRKCFAKEGLV